MQTLGNTGTFEITRTVGIMGIMGSAQIRKTEQSWNPDKNLTTLEKHLTIIPDNMGNHPKTS
jgi:hypothetical protein